MHINRKLWLEGGIPRFYRGLAPALFQGPLARFGDTAANTAILALLEVGYSVFTKSCNIPYLFDGYILPVICKNLKNLLKPYDLPMAAKTGAASVSAGMWRIMITPIDTLKTTLQVSSMSL